MFPRQTNQPRSFFHGNEFMRLMTMVVMLGVILLLIVRASDPNTWTWLTNGAGAGNPQNSPAATGSEHNPAQNNVKQNSENKKNVEEALKPPEPSKPVESNEPAPGQNEKKNAKEAAPLPAGPTDLDPEEREAAAEEFQAVADGTLGIPSMENHAYDRLLQWVSNQTIAQMRRRAKKDPVYTQFYQSPEKYRGQLFEFDLNLRRILKYEYNDRTLYEVWGWTAESRSWPYVGVVLDLPKGMPIGSDVDEQATMVGYFFKMQGYLEAGAKPRASPLQAPLFVGRLICAPTGRLQAKPSDWSWALFLLAGFVIFLIIRWGLLLSGGRRRLFQTPKIQAKPGGKSVEDWLANVEPHETDESANDNDLPGQNQ